MTVGMRSAWRVSVTLIAAAIGGWIFNSLGWPAAWLAGGTIGVVILTAAGFRPAVPQLVRAPIFLFLGISVGASVTPETLENLWRWPVSIAALAVSVVAIMAATYAYFRRVAGWDAKSAFFGGVPGALSTTLLVAEEAGADLTRIAFVQSVRVLMLVAILPSVITATSPTTAGIAREAGGMVDLVITVSAAAIAGLVCHRLRVPGGLLVGAMLMSTILHATEIVHGYVPDAILIPGFVALGALIGSRFYGISLAEIRAFTVAALAGFAIGMGIATAFAIAIAGIVDLPFGQVLLAFAPGGFEAMVAMAFALSLDPAFVGTHQIVRFMAMSLLLPLIAGGLGFLDQPTGRTKKGSSS